MDQADVEATVNQLFALVNIIVEQLVTQPKKIAELFGTLPEGARNGIESGTGRSNRVCRPRRNLNRFLARVIRLWYGESGCRPHLDTW